MIEYQTSSFGSKIEDRTRLDEQGERKIELLDELALIEGRTVSFRLKNKGREMNSPGDQIFTNERGEREIELAW